MQYNDKCSPVLKYKHIITYNYEKALNINGKYVKVELKTGSIFYFSISLVNKIFENY